MENVNCQSCGEARPSYDIIHVGNADMKYRMLCSQCFNAEIAERNGIDDFENIRFEPIEIADCAGIKHEFHFQTRLLGDIVALDSFEVSAGVPSGYEFQLIGSPDEDMFGLLGRMIQKIRRTVSVKHLEDGDYGLQISGDSVKGWIDSDQSGIGRAPLLMIDGREVSWDEFGRMLMTFEGWQFKLDIIEPDEEA